MSEFIWTDELAMEYARGVAESYKKSEVWSGNYDAEAHLLQSFKASKQPKPEWEILEGEGQTGIHVWYDSAHDMDNCPMKGCKIHKVKRLSDGEIFTVGDKFWIRHQPGEYWVINKIEIGPFEDMRLIGDPGGYNWGLKIALKYPIHQSPIPVLLTLSQIEKLKKLLS